jgi:sugar lactone lactonase YvrE
MLSNDWMKGWTQRAMGLMIFALLLPLAAEASSSVPAVVISSQTTTVTSTGLGSNQQGIALDACGNAYTIQSGTGSVYETPFGGGTATLVLTGWAYSWSGDISIYINNAKTYAYISEGFGGNTSQVARIPIVNCALQAGSLVDIANNSGGGWWAAGAITTDAAGDIFFSSWNGNMIIETSADQTKQTVLVSGLSALPNAMAVDLSGNIFFAMNNGLYELAYSNSAYSTTPVQITTSTTYTSLVGLTLDAAGNLYVTDQGNSGWYSLNGYANAMYVGSTIYVIPNETSGSTSALNPADMYIFAQGTGASDPIEAPSQVAFDPLGNLYSVVGSDISDLLAHNVNVGSASVGGSGTTTLHVQFNASTTPASFLIAGDAAFTNAGSGTCAAQTYAAGSSCIVNVNFAPTHPGSAYGSLELIDASHNVLATAYLEGEGLGAGLTMDSGAVTSFGSGFTTPQSIAVSPVGGYYIADSGKNEVLYFATTSSSPVSIGATGTLKAPLGVAVDGAGNVFIADTGNNQIVEVPFINGALSNAAQTTIVTASVPNGSGGTTPTPIAGAVLKAPSGITVDGQGNLFIADTGNNRIVFLPYNGSWNVANASVIGSGFNAPLATAVDSSGNLYVADSGAGQIYELQPPYNGNQQLVAVGYSNPSALAADASGSLFVVDQGANTVLRIPNISGMLNSNAAIEAGFGVAAPYGVAVDATGNLWVTDATHAIAYEINRVSTTLSFGAWALSSPSGPLPVKLEDEGNQNLVFNSPFYTASGNTGDFSLGTPTGTETACANSGTVAVGAVCEMDAIFTPAASGTRTDTLVLQSNAQNATAAPQLILSGVGSSASATTTVLAKTSPSGTPSFGQAITLTATVTSSGGTPAGSAQLLVDGVIAGEATLSSGGVATFSLPLGLSGGSHSLQAIYLCSGSCSTFAGSTSVALPLTVSQTATTTAITITPPFTNPNSVLSGGAVTLTATINFAGVGIPTGTVAFATGTGTSLGSANVVPAAGGLFQASLSTTALTAVGTYTFTAIYSGDANYVTSSVAGGSVIVVSNPQVIVTPGGPSLTVNSSTVSSSTITLTPASYGGFNGIVGFQCDPATLPVDSTCVFSPGQVNVTPNTPSASYAEPVVTMWIAINQPPQTPTASKMIWWIAGPTGFLLLFVRRRIKAVALASYWNMLLLISAIGVLSAGMVGSIGCSNGLSYVTPKGATNVTVYAYADTYVVGTTNNTTSTCTASSVYPCSKQAINVSVTVQ